MEAIIELQIYYFTHHQKRKVLRFSNVHDCTSQLNYDELPTVLPNSIDIQKFLHCTKV